MKLDASFFGRVEPVSYRWYEPDRVVLGRRMAEHLRIAVCYWHTLVAVGSDPFGEGTFRRPWHLSGGDSMQQARLKADVAFDLLRLLKVDYFTFHDRDIAPEGRTLRESNLNLRRMSDVIGRKMSRNGVKLLWAMSNLCGNRRYMSGAATNPDPEVFAYAAAQVASMLELTRDLDGENFAFWGGREGYETLLNTDIKRERDQWGRFLAMVVEHKYRIGFKGAILIEAKPAEPSKEQYDRDIATIFGFLQSYGLHGEVKVNIEQNHALLAGHTFEHEIALAQALDVFGSVDMNRGDELLGWDTVHFANNLPQMVLAMYQIVAGGGFTTGGLNFDARVRRQSINPDELVAAHADSIDLCARALLVVEATLADGELPGAVARRYDGWNGRLGKTILAGKSSLSQLAAHVDKHGLDPQPRSGRQEQFEAMANRHI